MKRAAPTTVASLLALTLGPVLLAGLPADAAPVRVIRLQSGAAFLNGTLDGISIDPLGTLQLTDRVERLASIQEPFLLAAARSPEGWVLGTGNSGKVLQVSRQGKVETLFAAPEPEVFALWVDPDGTVFAGTSPQGKVYRIAKGKTEVFFDPKEAYIWALARAADGALLVATGTQGRLYRVEKAGEGKVFFDSTDTHLRSLLVMANGEVLVGTAGEGLVLQIDKTGRARTIFDAQESEIVALAAAPDGTYFAAAVSAETLVPEGPESAPAGAAAAPGGHGEEAAKEGSDGDKGGKPAVTVTVTEGPPAAAGARGASAGGHSPRSEVLRIAPGGVAESVWSFADETVYSLLWQRGRLWVGTGLEGKLFSFESGKMVLERDVDERQVVALLGDEPGPSFATTNAAALYRSIGGPEHKGTFTSPPLDAGQVSRFGTFRWRGETPRGARLRFTFRSGISATPDRTWSDWTAPQDDTEIALKDVPRGRFLQWRGEFAAEEGVSPRLHGVEITYRALNLRPRIARFAPLDAGEVLMPVSFNPLNQVYEPAHPNHDGMFAPLQPAPGAGEGQLKPLWKKGYRTLRWEASDPNEDPLVYTLSFRPEASPSSAGSDWLPMAEELTDTYYSFDESALPDGVYRFRLRASDKNANDPADALEAEEVSEPVLIDSTPPQVRGVRREPKGLRVEVADALSPLRTAEWSADGGKWQPARAADGLLDGKSETLLIEPPAGARLVLLRLIDAAWNTATFDLSSFVDAAKGTP